MDVRDKISFTIILRSIPIQIHVADREYVLQIRNVLKDEGAISVFTYVRQIRPGKFSIRSVLIIDIIYVTTTTDPGNRLIDFCLE